MRTLAHWLTIRSFSLGHRRRRNPWPQHHSSNSLGRRQNPYVISPPLHHPFYSQSSYPTVFYPSQHHSPLFLPTATTATATPLPLSPSSANVYETHWTLHRHPQSVRWFLWKIHALATCHAVLPPCQQSRLRYRWETNRLHPLVHDKGICPHLGLHFPTKCHLWHRIHPWNLHKFNTAFKHHDVTGNTISWLSTKHMLKNAKNNSYSPSLTEYVSTFKNHVALANISDANVLIVYFSAGIPPPLMCCIMSMDTVPSTINDWYKKAIAFQTQWERADDIARRNLKTSHQTYHSFSNSSNTKAHDPNTMVVDTIRVSKLTPKEHKCCIEKKLCFHCQKTWPSQYHLHVLRSKGQSKGTEG